MSKIVTTGFLGSLLVSALFLGCRADTSGLATLTVPELAALLEEDERAVVCDANTADTRERYGTVPGALLLSSYRDYEPEVELPAERDRPLVFYCHSEWCGAAASAARKAVAAGYTDVFVLPGGIEGWRDAGRSVDPPVSGAPGRGRG